MTENTSALWKYFHSINFIEPVMLQLLAVPLALFVIAITFWLLWLYRRPKTTYGSRYPLVGRFKFWLSLIIAMALLVLALARPYVKEGSLIVKRGNAEVIFIVDYSASMFLKDTGLARIDIASRELKKLPAFEILKEGDRAALFILGLSGVRYLPLTSDLSSFVAEVSKLGVPNVLYGTNVYWGSNIGSTFEKVYNSLDRQDAFVIFKGKEPPKGWRAEVKSNRLVVFIGDGDYFNYDDSEKEFEKIDKDYFEAGLSEFRRRGLKIYPIGIGTRTGGKMPDILKGYIKDKEYDPKLEVDLAGQESRLNAYTLEYMRNATGAEKLLLMENSDADASGFLKTVIDSHRNMLIEPSLSQEKEELWLYFVLAALSVFLIGMFITKF